MQSPNYFTCYITIPLYVFQQDENERCALLPVRQSPMDLGRSRPASKYKARPEASFTHCNTGLCSFRQHTLIFFPASIPDYFLQIAVQLFIFLWIQSAFF